MHGTLTKICSSCRVPKPATRDHFIKHDGTRNGITQPCRECHKARMRQANRAVYSRHREREIVRQYAQIDARSGLAGDLDIEWFKANITSKPCFYCETVSEPRGADRVDNAKGHTKANVIPCCKTCNKVRNNLFTVAEMKRLGETIKAIRRDRQFARL